jgi:hypothetical protein
MTDIYLHYEQHTEQNIDRHSDEPYDYSWSSRTEFTPLGLYTKQGSWVETLNFLEDAESYIDQEISIIVVRYSSGDTFGNGIGKWSIPHCFLSNKDLEEELVNSIKAENELYKNNRSEWNEKFGVYKDWLGYFERLESIDVFTFILKDEVCPTSKYW